MTTIMMRIAIIVLGGAALVGGALVWTAPAKHAPARVAVSLAPRVKPAPPKPAPDPSYVVKHILPVAGPMRQGDFYWDETGAPSGPVVVTIDLAAQTLSVFRAGYEIGTAVIIYGADGKPTPLGVFPILQKDAHHLSRTYDNAPMPYMLRLTNDGISIHGSKVGNGYVTHGCIGLPVDFAKRLFAVVKLGDKAIITNGETLDVGGAITAA